MSKRGRNEPCPSGAGVKFKNCLRQHPNLGLHSTAADIWWVCDRWQADEPDFDQMRAAWRRAANPDPDKVERFLERMSAEPVASVEWASLLMECHEKHLPDLPRWYRRMREALSEVDDLALARLHRQAVEIFQYDHPDMYAELLTAILALDPNETEMESLEGIVAWALCEGRTEDCDRLRERFPEFPQHMLEEPEGREWDEAEDLPGTEAGKEPAPEFPPEVERKLDAVWNEFQAIESPTPADADALLETLLELPHEATHWHDVFDVLVEVEHPDLFGIVERMMSAIGSSEGQDLSYVAWGAMGEAIRRGETERLPTIARSLQQLDATECDPDAVSHLEDHLLAYGYVDECLGLKEYVYPALCSSKKVMGWVVPRAASEIFDLRMGKLVASGGLHQRDVETIHAELIDGIAEQIDKQVTARLIRLVLQGPEDRSRLERVLHLSRDKAPAGAQENNWIARLALFVEVAASHHGKTAGSHPARTLVGLQMIESAAYHRIDTHPGKEPKSQRNLLSYLDPENIERQVASESRDLVGINVPRARIMLDAHTALALWAERQGLALPADCREIVAKVDALHETLNE
jgi:hypothetical protein